MNWNDKRLNKLGKEILKRRERKLSRIMNDFGRVHVIRKSGKEIVGCKFENIRDGNPNPESAGFS